MHLASAVAHDVLKFIGLLDQIGCEFRDLTPENLWIDSRGHIKVIGFTNLNFHPEAEQGARDLGKLVYQGRPASGFNEWFQIGWLKIFCLMK